MPDPNSAEIRQILGEPPSRFAFRLLCTLIDDCHDPVDQSRAIDEAQRVLNRWPAWTRHVSIQNCGQMTPLLRRPSWPLVRSLYWTAIAESADVCVDRVTAELASDPNAVHLRRLDLDLSDDEVLLGLALPTKFPNLRRLSIDLSCDNRRDVLLRFLASDLPRRLRSLTIKGIGNLDDDPRGDAFDIVDAIDSASVSHRLRTIRLPYISDATFAHFLDRFRRPLSDIGHQNWTTETIDLLCRREELTSGLKALDFRGHDFDRRKLELIAKCPHLGRLEQLNFGESTIGPDGATILAGSTFISNLKHLNLHRNPLGDEGWEVLAQAPFQRLRSLDLSWNGGVTMHGPQALARAGNLAGLRSLSLDGNPIGDEGVSTILDAGFTDGLRALGLSSVKKTPATADLLADHPLKRLRAVKLGVDEGGAEFGRRFARSGRYPLLSYLDLMAMNLGDQGIGHLAEATGFPALKRIDLSNNDLTDIGIRRLVQSPFVTPIREFWLRGNPGIQDAGVAALADSPFLRNVVNLGMNLKLIGEGTCDILRKSINTRLLFNPNARGSILD